MEQLDYKFLRGFVTLLGTLGGFFLAPIFGIVLIGVVMICIAIIMTTITWDAQWMRIIADCVPTVVGRWCVIILAPMGAFLGFRYVFSAFIGKVDNDGTL